MQDRLGQTDVDAPSFHEQRTRLGAHQIVEVAVSRPPMRKIDRRTQEVEPLVFETKREVEIRTAARERLVKSLHRPNGGAAHEQGKILKEQAVRRLRQMTAHPRSRILPMRRHLLRIHVLPCEFRTVGERADGGDRFIRSKDFQHLCESVRREDDPRTQKEQGLSCGGCRPHIPPRR